MTFKQWIQKELKEGTFRPKYEYLIPKDCQNRDMINLGLELDTSCVDYDMHRLFQDIFNMKKRYESTYSSEFWDKDYVCIKPLKT